MRNSTVGDTHIKDDKQRSVMTRTKNGHLGEVSDDSDKKGMMGMMASCHICKGFQCKNQKGM